MQNMKPIHPMGKDDPRFPLAIAAMGGRRDPFLHMPRDVLAKYQGKLVAILDDSGQIIADASTPEQLEQTIANTEFANRPWSYRNAPPLD